MSNSFIAVTLLSTILPFSAMRSAHAAETAIPAQTPAPTMKPAPLSSADKKMIRSAMKAAPKKVSANATVIAMEESEVGLLERGDFERYLLSNDRICKDIIRMLCGRLRDAWMMIKVMSFANAEQRVIVACFAFLQFRRSRSFREEKMF